MKRTLVTLAAVGIVAIGATAAQAVTLGSSWGMVPTGSTVADQSGSNRSTTLDGSWAVVTGGVDWQSAPAGGTVANSAASNPGTADVAIGARITSDPITQGNGYSGNVIQKGLFGDPGQIKAQLIPKNEGTFNCRFKGTSANRLLQAPVSADNVDDGAIHWVMCWREGSTLGVTVDGVTSTVTLNIGSLSNNKNVRVGNKSATAGASDQHFGINYCSAYSYGSGARTYVQNLISGDC